MAIDLPRPWSTRHRNMRPNTLAHRVGQIMTFSRENSASSPEGLVGVAHHIGLQSSWHMYFSSKQAFEDESGQSRTVYSRRWWISMTMGSICSMSGTDPNHPMAVKCQPRVGGVPAKMISARNDVSKLRTCGKERGYRSGERIGYQPLTLHPSIASSS